MPVNWSRTLLLYQEDDLARVGCKLSEIHGRGIPTLHVTYRTLATDESCLRQIRDSGCEALIFLRNDDMEDHPPIGAILRKLCLGYTTVSGIDPSQWETQTGICLRDLLSGSGEIPLPPVRPGTPQRGADSHGTCTLVFDLEQFGGARYAMPRLLPLLESNGIRATFFITGFIAEVFPSLLKRIAAGKHELAIHGSVHEFLQGRDLVEQESRVKDQLDLLGAYGTVRGANFIFRMDDLSPEAFVRAGLQYFVLFRKHLFQRTRFLPASAKPRPFRAPSGDIVLIPINVETYGLTLSEIRSTVDAAWETAQREGFPHISVLMHPFKDGTERRLPQTEHVMRYLLDHLGLRPIPLAEIPSPSFPKEDAVQFRYRWDENEAGTPEQEASSQSISWWRPPMYHARRIEVLMDSVESSGISAVLTSTLRSYGKTVHVFPDAATSAARITSDPLLTPQRAASEVIASLRAADTAVIAPCGPRMDRLRKALFHAPTSIRDFCEILARLRTRIRRLLPYIRRKEAALGANPE